MENRATSVSLSSNQAPEMIEGKPIGYAHDYWCLGVLIYEMIYTVPPFLGKSASKSIKFIQNSAVWFSERKYSVSDDAKDIVTNIV